MIDLKPTISIIILKCKLFILIKKQQCQPWLKWFMVGWSVVPFCKPKGLGFDAQSGHTPQLSVRSLVWVHTGGN